MVPRCLGSVHGVCMTICEGLNVFLEKMLLSEGDSLFWSHVCFVFKEVHECLPLLLR